MIVIESKKKKPENIRKKYRKKYPDAEVVLCDVTSQATDGLLKLSPFYPHGDIPVPFSEGWTATCVEAIWQGLKVFENADIDTALFKNATMKNIKRTVRRFGKPLGHRKGVEGEELLSYVEARYQIYIPTYRWMLEHKARRIIERLREANKKGDKIYVLLDYATNSKPSDLSKPLSHAYLVKAYVEGLPPYEDVKGEIEKDTAEVGVTKKGGVADRVSGRTRKKQGRSLDKKGRIARKSN